MRRVTLLLSGVPQYVSLRDLSYNLDLLFNTDEIETFNIRDLPNHPQTNGRQVALDFRSGYDAMAAQEKLEGYAYELDNGREYTLHAKINKYEEYMCSESTEHEGSRWHVDEWMALAMIPKVSDRDMYKAHDRLDAQLQLLKKQKLVLEKEEELLSEKQRLKRKYGAMVGSLYEDTPRTQPNHNVECHPISLTQLESTDNAPQIKQEPTEAPIIIIDIDSAEKPVPRHPQFIVVIKTLVKNMNAVIQTNKLGGEIKFTELKHVLRHVLRNLLKGQGFLPREEIIRKFREVYPMENDERFVRNTIKDIKDGKYPGLTGHIVDTPVPENDENDDVVLIEKQYEVVSLLDSDGNRGNEREKIGSYDRDVGVISSPSRKVANSRKRKKRSRKRKSAGEVQENPAKGRNIPEDSKDNDNKLEVTAITIVTSLNELIVKSNASETEVEEPNEIKKEIEIEEETLDESSLQLPDDPRVTSITIMTSDAELFALGQEDRKQVDEIKNESDVYYDAEDNLVNDIQRAFDDANFCNSMQKEQNNNEQNNSVNSVLFSGGNNSEQFSSVNNSEQFSSVNNSEQFSSVNNSEQFISKAAGLPQDSRKGQDEEETIESIVKYVASMYEDLTS